MAEHLESIFGTEKDRVNCPFYFKIGACRHGDRCSKLHTKLSISPTLLLPNMFQRPIDPLKMQQHFEIGSLSGCFDGMLLILMMLQDFYEDLFEELNNYGEIENLNICDNIMEHMVGNVYVQFREEEQAAKALKNLIGRLYAGRPIIVEFSNVTNFHEASCMQYEESSCCSSGYCNFMHLKKISRELRHKLFGRYRTRQRESRSRSRSRSPYRHRNYEVRSHKSHSRKYNDRDHYHESRSRRHSGTSPGHRRGRSRSPMLLRFSINVVVVSDLSKMYYFWRI